MGPLGLDAYAISKQGGNWSDQLPLNAYFAANSCQATGRVHVFKRHHTPMNSEHLVPSSSCNPKKRRKVRLSHPLFTPIGG